MKNTGFFSFFKSLRSFLHEKKHGFFKSLRFFAQKKHGFFKSLRSFFTQKTRVF